MVHIRTFFGKFSHSKIQGFHLNISPNNKKSNEIKVNHNSIIGLLGDPNDSNHKKEIKDRVGKNFDIIGSKHNNLNVFVESIIGSKNHAHWLLRACDINKIENKKNLEKRNTNNETIPASTALVFHTASTRNNIMDINHCHLNMRKFSMIGYHFVITQEGVIIETRPISKKGSHVYGYNDSIGICFEKNLNSHELNEYEISATNTLVNLLITEKSINSNQIYGHNTAHLMVILESIQKELLEFRIKGKNFDITAAEEVIKELESTILLRHQDKSHSKKDILNHLKKTKSFLNSHRNIHVGNDANNTPLYVYINQLKDCPGKKFKFSYLSAKPALLDKYSKVG